MHQLASVIHYLTMNPGSFASLVPPLLNNIKLCCESPTELQEIIEVVIVQVYNTFIYFFVNVHTRKYILFTIDIIFAVYK